MAPRYMRVCVKLLLTDVLLFVISTASTKQDTPKKTERGDYVIKNIGIKLCQLKCAEHGQCESVEYNIETLTCHLLRDESKIEKEGRVILERNHSHVPTDSCKCSFGQRCLKTRSGKQVCVQVSASTSDADTLQDLTPCKTIPPAPMTTQLSDPHATPSPAERRFYNASKSGDLERVKRILTATQVNINTRSAKRSRTPVMWAARRGHRDVVEFLVGRGADVSLVDKYGDNILHLACLGGHLETVKLILSLDVLDINTRNNDGKTAAEVATAWFHQEVYDLLMSRGDH